MPLNPDLDFSQALDAVKSGLRLSRREWKNAGYIYLVEGSVFTVDREPLNQFLNEGMEVTYRPHIDMMGTDGRIGTWSPSSVDLFAKDWYVFDDKE